MAEHKATSQIMMDLIKRTEEKAVSIEQVATVYQEKSQKNFEELAADGKVAALRFTQVVDDCKKLSSDQSSLTVSIHKCAAVAQERLDDYKKQVEDKFTSFGDNAQDRLDTYKCHVEDKWAALGEKIQYNACQSSTYVPSLCVLHA